jgi:hypothetical protein
LHDLSVQFALSDGPGDQALAAAEFEVSLPGVLKPRGVPPARRAP